MDELRSKTGKVYHSKGIKYYGEDLKEVATTHEDEEWQFVRVEDENYPRKCVRIEGDKVLVSIPCLEMDQDDKSTGVDVSFIDAELDQCEFFYVTDSEGHPIEWKIKR